MVIGRLSCEDTPSPNQFHKWAPSAVEFSSPENTNRSWNYEFDPVLSGIYAWRPNKFRINKINQKMSFKIGIKP
jgi:hypothetical protein